jgi:hypothetical protein
MDEIKLVLCCASHMNSTSRLPYLAAMIRSWEAQSLRTQLWLSISYDAAVPGMKEAIMRTATSHPARLKLFIHRTRRSQFDHYQFLLQRIGPEDRKWLAFVDDDDILGNCRMELFKMVIAEVFPDGVVERQRTSNGRPYCNDSALY